MTKQAPMMLMFVLYIYQKVGVNSQRQAEIKAAIVSLCSACPGCLA